jgi:hypothetical protein
MLCFPLDRPHIREYVKHPRELLAEVDGKAEWNRAVASPGLALPDSPRGNSSMESERIQRCRSPLV